MGLSPALHHARAHLQPWSGMIGAGLGWVLSDQFGSNFTFDHCEAAHPVLMLVVGAIGLAIAVIGAVWSLPVWRDEPPSGRRFVAALGVGMAALFAVAIILQTVASLIIPRCFG
ncbi:hypothetical protein [Rhizorhabdus argentea]|uniref:hypothetical protein n=1 Tax=Rhizorhabdus argentea TaxID=1387174 RepID=UPI0030EC48DC